MADFDKATALTWDDEGVIEKAIEDAYQSGRRDGLEEAAKLIANSQMFCADEKKLQKCLAAAIRKRCEDGE